MHTNNKHHEFAIFTSTAFCFDVTSQKKKKKKFIKLQYVVIYVKAAELSLRN